jgi:hypothetical protein
LKKKITKPKGTKAKRRTISEDRVRNAVVGHIADSGYSKDLKIKSGDEHGVDISATHKDSKARRIFVETKGGSPGANKNVSIHTAWGQILGRVTSLNANRIHGLAFPKDWETNVAKLSSPVVAKKLNVRYYFVDDHGVVQEFTANKFHEKHSKKRLRTKSARPSKKKR